MEWMNYKYLLLVVLLGMGSLGRAVDIAVLSNQNTALVPLKYYCAITHARCIQSHGKYIVRKGRKQVVLQLFDRSLMIGRRKVIVPTPPMKLIGVTCIPLRPIARYFGDRIYTDGEEIIIFHQNKSHSIEIRRMVNYLDTGSIAPNSCAFTVWNTCFRDDTPHLKNDSFIARNGRILWSEGNYSTSPETDNAVMPPQLIRISGQVSLIAFTGLTCGAHPSEMTYFLLSLDGNRVRNVLPKNFFQLPCTTSEAGIVLQRKRTSTLLIVYESTPIEIAYAANPKHGSYSISWYRWERGQFRYLYGKKTAVVQLYNRQQLRRIFKRYHIAGRKLLTDWGAVNRYDRE